MDYILSTESFWIIKNKVRVLYDLLDEILYRLMQFNNAGKVWKFKESLAMFGLDEIMEKIGSLEIDKNIENLKGFLEVIGTGI